MTYEDYDDTNVFARILKKQIPAKIIAENQYAICIVDKNPQADRHYLVIPRGKYIDALHFHHAASSAEIRGLWELVDEVSAENCKIQMNLGSYLEVKHFHIHVLYYGH